MQQVALRFAEDAGTTEPGVVERITEYDWSGLWNKISELAIDAAWRIVLAVVALIAGKLLIRLVMRIIRRGRLIKKLDAAVVRFLTSFIKVALNALLIIILIGILGVPMSSMVAVLASVGAAIGLAMQGSLGNFAGGLMILIFRPFRLDDYIEVGDYSGTVTDIGIFYTVLKTPDNKSVTIPNGTVTGQTIVNYSAHDTRRLELSFTVAYGTDLEKVKTALLETAKANKLVLKNPAPFANLKAHEDSALRFILRVWVKREDYWTLNFELMEQINNRFAADGIKIPFPQVDVHMIPEGQSEQKEEKTNE